MDSEIQVTGTSLPQPIPTPGRQGWDDETRNQLRALIKDGLSYLQIAHRMGRSRSAIAGECFRLGLRRAIQHKGGISLSRLEPLPAPPPTLWQDLQKPPIRKPRKPRSLIELKAIEEQAQIKRKPRPRLVEHKALLELNACDCRWPYGEPGTKDFFFCAAEVVAGHPYCEAHCKRAYAYSSRSA